MTASERIRAARDTEGSPHIYWIKRGAGIAGQYCYSARVGYENEAPREVLFVGSEYGGPVVMRTEYGETFVTDPGRFGEKLDRDWVRRFFTDTLTSS